MSTDLYMYIQLDFWAVLCLCELVLALVYWVLASCRFLMKSMIHKQIRQDVFVIQFWLRSTFSFIALLDYVWTLCHCVVNTHHTDPDSDSIMAPLWSVQIRFNNLTQLKRKWSRHTKANKQPHQVVFDKTITETWNAWRHLRFARGSLNWSGTKRSHSSSCFSAVQASVVQWKQSGRWSAISLMWHAGQKSVREREISHTPFTQTTSPHLFFPLCRSLCALQWGQRH